MSIFLVLTLACQLSPEEKKEQRIILSDSTFFKAPVLELCPEQQAAFEALNKIQSSTDKMNRLYSTFPNIRHSCYPADSTFEISQSELYFVMQEFVNKECENLKQEIRNQLSKSSVLAQENYLVQHCKFDMQGEAINDTFQMYGKWVIPNILGRRDLVISW